MVQQQERVHTSTPQGGSQRLMLVMALFVLIVGALVWMMARSGRPERAALLPVGTLPMQTLAAVPDNQSVHIDSDTLVNLANLAVTPDQAIVDVRDRTGKEALQNDAFNNEWTIVKSGGKVSVYAWTRADQALELANGLAATVYSSRPPWVPAANLTTVQVPLYRFSDLNTDTSPFTAYTADGKEDVDRSVLYTDTITDTATAVKNIVENKVHDLDGNIGASVQDNTVTLGGNIDLNTRQRARQIAKEALEKAGVPYQVSNGWNE